jgi:Methylamine utilisation protein MauE
VAAVAKLADRDGARQAAGALGVPHALAPPVAAGLPVAELAVAVALLFRRAAVAGAVGALVLLGFFLAGITLTLVRGRQPDCRCFGQLHRAPVTWKTLVRNLALAAGAALVAVEGPGSSLGAWSSGLSGIEWLTLLVAIALAVAFAVEGSQLVERWRRRR